MTKHVKRVTYRDMILVLEAPTTCCRTGLLVDCTRRMGGDFERGYAAAQRLNALIKYCDKHMRDFMPHRIAWYSDECGIVILQPIIALAASHRLAATECWPSFNVAGFTRAIMVQIQEGHLQC